MITPEFQQVAQDLVESSFSPVSQEEHSHSDLYICYAYSVFSLLQCVKAHPFTGHLWMKKTSFIFFIIFTFTPTGKCKWYKDIHPILPSPGRALFLHLLLRAQVLQALTALGAMCKSCCSSQKNRMFKMQNASSQ